MPVPNDRFHLDRVLANLNRVKSDLPKSIAAETKNYFVREFNDEKWDGKQWQDVKRKNIKGGSQRNQSHILVQSGKLRRSLINSLQSADWSSIKFRVVDVPYARVHNEGLMAGRGAGFKMPKRQFMGDTSALRKIQREKITFFIGKIWK